VVTGNNTWTALLGTGGGAFASPISGNALGVDRFFIAPFPEDTALCLITANSGSTNKVIYSACSNTYNYLPLATTPPGNHLVDVADWSHDGSLDLLSYYNQGEIRLWRNCDTLDVVTGMPATGTRQDEGLSLYPVPASDAVTVVRPAAAQGMATVRLINARGQEVLHLASKAALQEVPLHGVAPGVYMLHYRTANGLWSARLAVAR
jgi:hypothetical protein